VLRLSAAFFAFAFLDIAASLLPASTFSDPLVSESFWLLLLLAVRSSFI
jgi:hypothetical protein